MLDAEIVNIKDDLNDLEDKVRSLITHTHTHTTE